MVKTTRKKALIIGGGVAGPTTAIALQPAGIDAVVYEANEASVQDKSSFLTVAMNGMGNVVGSTEKEEVSHCTRRPLKSVKGLPRQVLSSEELPCFRCPCVK